MKGRPESLEEFYRQGEILLTGGTGFLGKLLIVKLMRSFPDLGNIYVMVRDKKGSNPEQRVVEMFQNVIFEKLDEEVPDFKSRIQAVSCNFSAPDLGLSASTKDLLLSRVNIVMHLAATVKFDEDIQVAIDTNMRATQGILNLAKQCPNLKMFTYVSTAFSQTKRHHVGERIYQPLTHYTELLELSSLSGGHPKLESMRNKLADQSANTYTLTKAAAEQLISEEAKNFPATIFRPSIVISTLEDPIPGYIDNLYGPTGLVTGVQTGVIRSVFCCPGKKADMVPADFTVNALICTTWDGYNKFQSDSSSLPIYNFVTSRDNSITWKEFQAKSVASIARYPYSRMLMSSCVYMSNSRPFHALRCLLLHYLVGYVFDLYFRLSGQTLRLVRVYKKMDKVMSLLEPFTTNDWDFDSQNTSRAWSLLNAADKERFPFNMAALDWDDYLDNYIQGTLVHHLQDKLDPGTRKKAMKRANRLHMLHQTLKALLYVFLMFGLWSFILLLI